jgi:hypothetical protein
MSLLRCLASSTLLVKSSDNILQRSRNFVRRNAYGASKLHALHVSQVPRRRLHLPTWVKSSSLKKTYPSRIHGATQIRESSVVAAVDLRVAAARARPMAMTLNRLHPFAGARPVAMTPRNPSARARPMPHPAVRARPMPHPAVRARPMATTPSRLYPSDLIAGNLIVLASSNVVASNLTISHRSHSRIASAPASPAISQFWLAASWPATP